MTTSSGSWTTANVDSGNHMRVDWYVSSINQSANTLVIHWNAYWQFLASPLDAQLDNPRLMIYSTNDPNGSLVMSYGRAHDYAGNFSVRNVGLGSGNYTVTADSAGNSTMTITGQCTEYSGQVSAGVSPSYNLPRVPKVPSAPGTPSAALYAASGDNSDGMNISWGAPGDDGGSGITKYTLQISTRSDFASNVYSWDTNGTSFGIGAQGWNTTWYFRVNATNGVGTSGWSGVGSKTTGVNTPTAPGTPTIGAILPISAASSWTAPGDNRGASVDNYEIEISANSNFASLLHDDAQAGLSKSWTGLLPSTTYYVRVRAHNSAGWGAWSGTATFKTLVGLHYRSGGTWLPAEAWFSYQGQWQPLSFYHRTGGTWK